MVCPSLNKLHKPRLIILEKLYRTGKGQQRMKLLY